MIGMNNGISKEHEIISEIMYVSTKYENCTRQIRNIEEEVNRWLIKLHELEDTKEELQDKINRLNEELIALKSGGDEINEAND